MKKFRLLSAIISLCLCVSVLVFGVYSALTVNFTVGGSITYTATEVQATISQATVGAGLTVDGSNKMQELVYQGPVAEPSASAVNSWSGLNITLTSNTAATITFTITNTHAERYLKILPSAPGGGYSSATNATITYTGMTAGTALYLDPVGGSTTSVEITITFAVTNTRLSASITGFTIPIALENTATNS